MAKNEEPVVVGDQHLLVYLGKVLTAKTGDKTLADRIRESSPLPVGEHEVEGVIEFSLHATVGEDYETDRYKGVALDEVLTWIMATVPGFMEDKLRRAAAIVIELKRAEDEKRKPRAITWTDEGGTEHRITAKEIAAEQEKVEAWKTRAQNTLAPFAKVIKQRVPAKGRLSVSQVRVQVGRTAQRKPTIPVVRVGAAK
jgi:hypothetical protein